MGAMRLRYPAVNLEFRRADLKCNCHDYKGDSRSFSLVPYFRKRSTVANRTKHSFTTGHLAAARLRTPPHGAGFAGDRHSKKSVLVFAPVQRGLIGIVPGVATIRGAIATRAIAASIILAGAGAAQRWTRNALGVSEAAL